MTSRLPPRAAGCAINAFCSSRSSRNRTGAYNLGFFGPEVVITPGGSVGASQRPSLPAFFERRLQPSPIFRLVIGPNLEPSLSELRPERLDVHLHP